MKISWHDPRLTWNSSDFGGMKKIKVNSTLLWKPDIVLHNSVTGNFKTTEQGHHYKGTKKIKNHVWNTFLNKRTSISQSLSIRMGKSSGNQQPFIKPHVVLIPSTFPLTRKTVHLNLAAGVSLQTSNYSGQLKTTKL